MKFWVEMRHPKVVSKPSATHGPFTSHEAAQEFLVALAFGNGIEWATSTKIVTKEPK